tara:strand:- start:4518 stop:5903 length:1386 start_codon:yes stop_codon:yes gene_type:complete
MPALIIAGVVAVGSTLFANHKRKKAAEDAQDLLQAQVNARNELIDEYESGLAQLMQDYEDGKLPVHKVVPEKGKVGESAYDAVETAKSDRAIESVINEGKDMVTQAANVSDPRIKQFVMQKAHKDHVRNVEKAQAESVDRIMSAQTQLGAAETDVNKQFAQAKNQAESQYAQQVQSYMQNEQNRLNNLIAQQGENVMGAEYDAGMVVPMAQAQNAADFGATATSVAGSFVQDGIKVPYADEGYKVRLPEKNNVDYLARFDQMMGDSGSSVADAFSSISDEKRQAVLDKYKANRDEGKFFMSKRAQEGLRNGGFTQGEFNHGDPDKPETGNDQVLLDQEDLKRVMDEGGVNSFDDLMAAVPPQIITTGGEIVKNDKNSGDEEDLTDATDINNPIKVEDIDFRDQDIAQKAMNDILTAKDGRKLFANTGKKNNKKTQQDVRKAEMMLAAYNRHLLAQPQFQNT